MTDGAFQLVSVACSCPSIPVPNHNKPSQSKPSSGCTGVHLILLDPDLHGPDRNPASQQPPEPRDKSSQNPTHDYWGIKKNPISQPRVHIQQCGSTKRPWRPNHTSPCRDKKKCLKSTPHHPSRPRTPVDQQFSHSAYSGRRVTPAAAASPAATSRAQAQKRGAAHHQTTRPVLRARRGTVPSISAGGETQTPI